MSLVTYISTYKHAIVSLNRTSGVDMGSLSNTSDDPFRGEVRLNRGKQKWGKH